MRLLRRAALVAIPIGAAGTVALFFRASDKTPPVLIVLFLLWLLSPFAILVWTHVRSTRWTGPTQAALYAVTIVITLASLAIYGRIIAVTRSGAPKAAPFVIVAPASWLLVAIAVPAAALFSRKR